MRNFGAIIMAAALLTVTAAQAASDSSSTSLAAGKPAGLLQAQRDNDDALFYIIGAGAIAAGVALLVSDSDNGHGSTPNSAPTTQ